MRQVLKPLLLPITMFHEDQRRLGVFGLVESLVPIRGIDGVVTRAGHDLAEQFSVRLHVVHDQYRCH
ncbi:MAG: hypothetical protein QM756_08920 [Polyangiaceae bacterium]